ncbi:MAG TPA: glycosyltransferase family A protein [Blastocatellia bacterium]
MPPLFSVIIATYNRANLLPRALESVWGQQYTDFEVIVVDDGSTDGTLAYLATLGERVRIFSQTNQGPGAARNLGAKNAQGDYLVFLDSDDVWFPWALSTFAEVVTRHNRPDFISARPRDFLVEGELDQVQHERLSVEVFTDYYAASRTGYFVGANMMVLRRSAFDAVNGFGSKKIYAEDCDLSLRLGLAQGFVQILTPVTLGSRNHPASARHDRDLMIEGMENLIRSERDGLYLGGGVRRIERLRLITMFTRPVSVGSLREHYQRQGWRLYWGTFTWHVRIARWKYLLGFPAMALGCALGLRRPAAQRELSRQAL